MQSFNPQFKMPVKKERQEFPTSLGRGGRIWTDGPQHPMLVRYQATLHPDFFENGKCSKDLGIMRKIVEWGAGGGNMNMIAHNDVSESFEPLSINAEV